MSRRFGVTWLVLGTRLALAIAAAAALILTMACVAARVDGVSMAPTLDNADRLFVDMLSYEWTSPRQGDIVVLTYPRERRKMVVKRLIAREGDIVEIAEGQVLINGSRVNDDYVPDAFRSHDNWGPTRIPRGYYFVLGDHRNQSADSRHFGMVAKRDIRGRISVRWWPLRSMRTF